jgi:hypothetical protein
VLLFAKMCVLLLYRAFSAAALLYLTATMYSAFCSYWECCEYQISHGNCLVTPTQLHQPADTTPVSQQRDDTLKTDNSLI